MGPVGPGAAPRRPRPGPVATRADLERAQARQQTLSTELERVRTTALAWRNGLGALLAGLIGFSLIKGRSDVGELTTEAGVVVGILLFLALVVGAVGALCLLRAAHGTASVVVVDQLKPQAISAHEEAIASAKRLRQGIVATVGCAGLLVFAVALTWYGPAKTKPQLRVDTDGGTFCGSVVRVAGGTLTLDTPTGEKDLDLDTVSGLAPVSSCTT